LDGRFLRDGGVDPDLPRQRLADARRPERRPRRQRPVACRHTRVVHDLAAAAGELRLSPLRHERAAVARPAAAPRGAAAMRTELAPGPWLRLSALVAAGGTLLAVVSGAAGLGTAPRLLAALVAPPLAA